MNLRILQERVRVFCESVGKTHPDHDVARQLDEMRDATRDSIVLETLRAMGHGVDDAGNIYPPPAGLTIPEQQSVRWSGGGRRRGSYRRK